MKTPKDSENKIQYMPIFMSIGISVGLALGAAFDNIPIGMCFGMAVGVFIGSSFDAKKRKESDDSIITDEKDSE